MNTGDDELRAGGERHSGAYQIGGVMIKEGKEGMVWIEGGHARADVDWSWW